ncbi:hypothetical protein SMB34_00630 [Thalassospira permensis NBRC 106175]|uniref:Uncharacterized protein n=1 Tax=Thalassospira permensis NBRC 106175 TaxID=1353532 RepID=A0ABR4TTY9_9PROT|nr:hypothetical protein SMB34_00630 [Thalassospira permensis NBRC 106175]
MWDGLLGPDLDSFFGLGYLAVIIAGQFLIERSKALHVG